MGPGFDSLALIAHFRPGVSLAYVMAFVHLLGLATELSLIMTFLVFFLQLMKLHHHYPRKIQIPTLIPNLESLSRRHKSVHLKNKDNLRNNLLQKAMMMCILLCLQQLCVMVMTTAVCILRHLLSRIMMLEQTI